MAPRDVAAQSPREERPRPQGAVGAAPHKSPLKFVALVFLLSTPFWTAGLLTSRTLSADLPIAALMFVAPVLAAVILVHREGGAAAVAGLLRRSFDFGRITDRRWYLPALLLGPIVYGSTYLLMRLTGTPVPDPEVPVLASLAAMLAFLAGGLGEELGWSGYAIDPLQARLGALRAGVLLGVVWAVWHAIPLVQVGRPWAWIGWWALGTVAFRVLLTWVYNNTGRSVAATALCHAVTNLVWIGPFLHFGPSGYPYEGERISALILTAAAVLVSASWGASTLTREQPPGTGST